SGYTAGGSIRSTEDGLRSALAIGEVTIWARGSMASSAAAAEAVPKGSEASSGIASPLPDQSTLVFVIPVFNEEENVPRLLADFESRPALFRAGGRVIL